MKALDNLGSSYPVTITNDIVTVNKASVPKGIEYIDIKSDSFNASSGDDGYYVIADANAKGSRLCKFNSKPDDERVYKQNLMPIFGIKHNGKSTLFIAEGFKYDMYLVIGVKNDNYYIYPRFMLNGNIPYEDISIKIVELDADDGYSEMAVAYRNYQLSRGAVKPLSEKAKERKVLDYAVNSPEIRIRMGWKPAPATVLEQTLETEPEMKVACTFDRVCDLVDELKAQGVDKAQICLVGWNKSGHDGRYPTIFPVEEKLGGEERLRHLIAYAQQNGYQIVCHTNSTDCYNIADEFSPDIVIKDKKGELAVNNMPWSGGNMYYLCPKLAWEYAQRDLPKVKEIGFEGLHYIDVMSVISLRWCYDKNHPLTSKETHEYYDKIMGLCRDLFGGFASEGTFDHCAEYLDYGLYASWPKVEDTMFDCEIPFWEIVYHGIILYNPTTNTVNYPIKEKELELQVVEYGARPAFYLYSSFLEGSDIDGWLGKTDLVCDTDEQLKHAVANIKKGYEDYKKVRHLQTEFITKHEEIEENIFVITYSDGTQVTVDYNNKIWSVKK